MLELPLVETTTDPEATPAVEEHLSGNGGVLPHWKGGAPFVVESTRTAPVYDPATGQLVHKSYLDLTDAKGHHNVYEMVVAGFSNGYIVALYLVAQLFLLVHLRHGIPSAFQTLGLKNARFRGPIDLLGLVVALVILIGNCAIVVAVQLGWVQSQLKPV